MEVAGEAVIGDEVSNIADLKNNPRGLLIDEQTISERRGIGKYTPRLTKLDYQGMVFDSLDG